MKIPYLYLLGIAIMLFSGCKKQPSPESETAESIPAKRTVIIYMAANNSLFGDAFNSIDQMERGAANLDGNLLVYIKTSDERSDLLKIKFDLSDRIVSDTVKSYTSSPGKRAMNFLKAPLRRTCPT